MHPNEKVLREGYAAMARGDGKALAEMLSPDAQWTIPGRSPLAGTYSGLKEIFSFWKRVAELALVGYAWKFKMSWPTTNEVWSSS